MNTMKENYYHVGLTDEEVRKSRAEHGVNLMTPPKRPSMWKLYLEKFQDPVVKVLLVAAFFSLVISIVENEYAETIGIIAAILLATGIGFFFEYDANKKFDLLNQVNEETKVKVIRNGHVQEIPRKDVVVGDIVVLETGEEVPADGQLFESISLQVNESNLTGEPVVSKTTVEADFDEDATYASNRVLRGTTVVDGHGSMCVDAVGDATEIGKVARQSTEQTTEPTPLNIQLTRLANLIGKIGFTAAGLAFAIFFIKDVLLYYDFSSFHTFNDWLPALKQTLQYFMMAVTLIVVAVPEGLPMSVTLSLALNMRRMLSTNNLVRKMHACETMGAITTICTDKTGTLTQNLMQVHEPNFYALKNHGDLGEDDISRLVAEGISANSTAFLEETAPGEKPKGVGNPTEVALLLWLNKQGQDYLPLRENAPVLDQLTFSTERKYMATLVQSPLLGKKVLYVKGAPEIVLGKCRDVVLDGQRVDATEYRSTVDQQLLTYQNMAMRTLGFAYKIVDDNAKADCVELAGGNDLSFLGIVAISDPIRPDVPAAVGKCQSAGISVKIVTGDTPGTATEIARQIGLWKPEDTERNRITGAAFAELSDEEALDRVLDLKIMSRARPTDKQRLVQLLQKKGAVVAVTGDGTNDAPALNHAQVGLSMGTGTSVAKEASDITLLDDSFNSIATAVMWGRSLYKNIQRFIVFQLTINLGEPHHGHLRRPGPGLHPAQRRCDAGKAPQEHGLHHHAPHVVEHHRRGHHLPRRTDGHAVVLQPYTRRHDDARPDRVLHLLRDAAILEPVQRPRVRHEPFRLQPPQQVLRHGTDCAGHHRGTSHHRAIRRRRVPHRPAGLDDVAANRGPLVLRAVGGRNLPGCETLNGQEECLTDASKTC